MAKKKITRRKSSSERRKLVSVTLSVAKLKQHEHNSRTHDEENIQAIIKSYKDFGEMQPIVVNKTNEILAGNGRHVAAQRMGLRTLQCVRITDLSPEEEELYQIADNKTGDMSSFDEEKLAIQFSRLDEKGLDLTSSAFAPREIQPLMDSAISAKMEGFARGEADLSAVDGEPLEPKEDGCWLYVEFYGEDDFFEQLLKHLNANGALRPNAKQLTSSAFKYMVEKAYGDIPVKKKVQRKVVRRRSNG